MVRKQPLCFHATAFGAGLLHKQCCLHEQYWPVTSEGMWIVRGFQMLAAMGYQHGQGLGKGQSGRAAPVPIQVKGGKHGLGIEENKKRKQQQAEQQQQERGQLQQ